MIIHRIRRLLPASLAAVALAVSALAALPAPAVSAAASEQTSRDRHVAVGLERAHAHNDYLHPRPLRDALDHGFKSVEADIWLVDGKLLVAHERGNVQQGKTLESLYLRPLRSIVRANHGSVYPDDSDYFTLLIDVKSAAIPTYQVLRDRLREYQRMLTTFLPHSVQDGAVTVMLSGTMSADDEAQRRVANKRVRYVSVDGRLADLGTGVPATFMPLISADWGDVFTWTGTGPMPENEHRRLHAIVQAAHANGQRVRFWDTPETPDRRTAVWHELMHARVDYINTDHLRALQDFLRAEDPRPLTPYISWDSAIGGGRDGQAGQHAG